jgi:molybdenum cofactor biosynthesis protein B
MSKADTTKPTRPLNCAILTISNSRKADSDTSGDYLAASLEAAGHRCTQRALSPENVYQVRKIISDWIANENIQIILTSGGTGFSHGQTTAAAITPLLDMTLAGFGELFRHLSYQELGSSMMQSDAFGGAANDTLIFCMPGSANACKTAWEGILKQQLDSTHRPCNFGAHYHA